MCHPFNCDSVYTDSVYKIYFKVIPKRGEKKETEKNRGRKMSS